MVSELEVINLIKAKQKKGNFSLSVECFHPPPFCNRQLILTLSNLSLFLTCCATKRDASIVFSISRYVGFSNVGLTSPQQFGLMSLSPGLKSSSSPLDNGSGSAGKGGSPKRDGGRAEMKEKENWLNFLKVNFNHEINS